MQIWGLVWNDTALSGGGYSSVAPEGPHVLVATGHTCSAEKSVLVTRNQIYPEREHRAGGVAYLIDAGLACTKPWFPSQHYIQAWGRKPLSQPPAGGAERSEIQGLAGDCIETSRASWVTWDPVNNNNNIITTVIAS